MGVLGVVPNPATSSAEDVGEPSITATPLVVDVISTPVLPSTIDGASIGETLSALDMVSATVTASMLDFPRLVLD